MKVMEVMEAMEAMEAMELIGKTGILWKMREMPCRPRTVRSQQ